MTINSKAKKILRVVVVLIFLAIALALFFIHPEGIMSYIGVTDSYALLFAFAFLDGFIFSAGISYEILIISLAYDKLSFILLVIIATIGVAIGAILAYYVGYSSRNVMPRKITQVLERLSSFCIRHPRLIPWTLFIYGAFVPLPNSLVVLTLGLSGYSFWKIIMPLSAGNALFNVILVYFGSYVYGISF